MSKEKIRKDIQRIRRAIKNAPRIMKFRGRRVIRANEWKYEDWTTFPDELTLASQEAPEEWRRDHLALLIKLEDPEFGNSICYDCAINRAQDHKAAIDRDRKHWEDQGGEEARQKFYDDCGQMKAAEFRRQDGMELVEWRIYNELAEANGRTCDVINYFKCPYGDERKRLVKDGKLAHKLWDHLQWYDRHWHPSTTMLTLAADPKWYHFNEPDVLNLADFDDIMKAFDDGRMEKIIAEHEQYMKETNNKIWAL